MDKLILTGYRGAGKTEVAKRVAGELGLGFFDMDARFNEIFGSIGDFVNKHGWDRMRYEEHEIFREGLGSTATIISTGGGTLIQDINRGYLQRDRQYYPGKITKIVFLQVSVEETIRRLIADNAKKQDRPALIGDTPTDFESQIRSEVPVVLAQRLPVYTKVANEIIDANGPIESVVRRVIGIIKK